MNCMAVTIEVPTEQDVNKADTDYYKTVYLFSTLSDELKKNDIEHKIEHDILNCDDKKVNPDFIILSEKKIDDIIEHKADLNASYAKKEIELIIKKYGCVKELIEGKKKFNPELIKLVPINLLKILEQTRDKNSLAILLSGFDVNLDIRKITFETHDELAHPIIEKILNDIIEFDPKQLTDFKFIKAEPKYVTYCSYTTLWPLLISFNDPNIAIDGYFEVDFDKVSKRASTFFPEWIRNNRQLANARLRRGLTFLNKINFVSWKEGSSTIKVHYTRGTRVGDLKSYFIKKYVEIENKKSKKGKKTSVDKTAQLKLF